MDRENLIDALALIAWNSEPKNAQTIMEAISLLKEQEAVEPNVAFIRVNGTKAFSCPRCSALIRGGSYCSHCGQALKGRKVGEVE